MESIIDDFRTERLHLRTLDTSDVESIFSIFSNEEVTRYWGTPLMKKLSDAEIFIEQVKEGFRNESLLEWGIVETDSDQLIGVCAYSEWDKENRRAEIGFAIHRNYWRKGYMTELLPDFLILGFKQLELHRIEADVDPANIASIKLLEKCGFQKEGCLQGRHLVEGEFRDALIYGLLAPDFPK